MSAGSPRCPVTWRPTVRTLAATRIVPATDQPSRRGSGATEGMEATLGWMPWLEPVEAKIAWLRASGTRWKEICWEVGLARAAAHEHWLYALCVIAWRLNGRERVKHIGRRATIVRVRKRGGSHSAYQSLQS